jgi:dual-specificity kinase
MTKVDDADGHYIVVDDAMLTSRCIVPRCSVLSLDKITRLLGQGTFGKVVQCYDRKDMRYCAVKIIRAVQKYRDASKIELRVLSTLSENDPNNSKYDLCLKLLTYRKCIHLQDCFDFRNHICIVTELLGMSVFDFLKGNNFVPFPSSHVQHFAKQLLESVACTIPLNTILISVLHALDLVHTDLKPENILLVNNDSYDAKCNTVSLYRNTLTPSADKK